MSQQRWASTAPQRVNTSIITADGNRDMNETYLGNSNLRYSAKLKYGTVARNPGSSAGTGVSYHSNSYNRQMKDMHAQTEISSIIDRPCKCNVSVFFLIN